MFGANLTVRHNSETEGFPVHTIGSQRRNLNSYTLHHSGRTISYINERWQVHGRVWNLFDTEYQEVFSFLSPGRAFYAGVRAYLQ